jgi:predicted deacylase
MPVISVKGAFDGPTMVVGGGIHGDALEGVEASIGLARDIGPAKLRRSVTRKPATRNVDETTEAFARLRGRRGVAEPSA